MQRLVGVLFLLFVVLGVNACGEPHGDAREVVEEFFEKLEDEEGLEAVRLLHPTFRDSLARDIKVPIRIADLKPSQAVACVLATMGSAVDKVEVLDTKGDEDRAEVKVRTVDKEGIDRILVFEVVKEKDRWFITDIKPAER